MKIKSIFKKKRESSWKDLLYIYRHAKLPWLLLIFVAITSFASEQAANWLVPYNTKISTGRMGEASFLLGFISLNIIVSVVDSLYEFTNTLGHAKTTRNFRTVIWRKLLFLPARHYKSQDPQGYISRITRDTDHAYAAVSSIIQSFGLAYGCILAIKSINDIYPDLTFTVYVSVPILFLCAFIGGKIQYKMPVWVNNAYSTMTNFYGERLPHVLHIKTNNMEKKEVEAAKKVNQLKYKADVKYAFGFALIPLINTFASTIQGIVVLVIGASLVRRGQLDISQMLNLSSYSTIVMSNATIFIGIWENIKGSHGGCSRISEIFAAQEEKTEGQKNALTPDKDIVFDHVAFSYTEEKQVLNDLSFTIPKGKMTAIIGENGSGKSTTAYLLERFDSPSCGKISYGDMDIADIDLMEWRDKFGYVFQGNQMVQGTLRDNITYGLNRDYTEEELIDAAKMANAYDFIMEKEQGFETPVGSFDSEFSGGQLQRIAMARVFMKNPDYMIFDEATSGLDYLTEVGIFDTIQNCLKDKTLIFITHNMNLVRKMDHVIVIDSGKLDAEGTVDEVSEKSQIFCNMLNAKK